MPSVHQPSARRRPALATALALPLVLLVLLTAALWARRAAHTGRTPASPGAATVVRVVDGDTLVVEVGDRDERVRLIGIDTPESVAPDRPKECFGEEASHRLDELVPPGTDVRLVRDVEPRDMYDRLLAYVERASDGLNINVAQVADGYAVAMPYPPNTAFRDDLAGAERSARAAGLGLWGACGGGDVPLESPPPGSPGPR